MKSEVRELFAKNRAEELGYDVWEHFVVPPFFEQLNIGFTRKPKVIIGGRGCGKTMLLRYLSHESAFSAKRTEIPESALQHIGVYWRSDTQFAQMMQRRGIKEEKWYAAFKHLCAVVIGLEVLRSVQSIADSDLNLIDSERLERLDFARISVFSSDLPHTFGGLRDHLEDELAVFETWVNDVELIEQPRFLPGERFVKRLIKLIQDQTPCLGAAVFYVYIDEYENLANYQQRLVNTWLKHSEAPLIFNLAMKRNGFRTRQTVSDETLSNVHDYRDIDLEDYDLEIEYPVFAAEVLLLQMKLAGATDLQVNLDILRDASAFHQRREREYTETIVDLARELFPSLTSSELANAVFSDKDLKKRLVDRISRALREKNDPTQPSDLIRDEAPMASIVVGSLVYRESVSSKEIREELDKLVKNEENRFTGSTNWIHNNFIGCLLVLYEGLTRPCPLYGGFNTFCYMSRGNLRHFLELCHQAIARATVRGLVDHGGVA